MHCLSPIFSNPFKIFRSFICFDSERLSKYLPSIPTTSSKEFRAEKISKENLLEKLQLEWSEQRANFLVALDNIEKIDDEARDVYKKFFESMSLENLSEFFQNISENELEGGGNLSEPILSLISEKTMKSLCGKVKIEKWIEEMSRPAERVSRHSEEVKAADLSRARVLANFFPNMFHVFFRAFDLVSASRPPDTAYEYAALATLYINFFKIPYTLVQVVRSFVQTSLQALVVSASLLGLAYGALYCYIRWIRGSPSQVSYCEKIIAPSSPVLYREQQYYTFESCLGNGVSGTTTNMVAVGKPGVGKSTWMKGLAVRFPSRKFFLLNAALFGGAYNSSVADKIQEAIFEMNGHEKEVVFCIDELGDKFESHRADIVSMFKFFADKKTIPFVCLLTDEQWDSIKKVDSAFGERFHKIDFKPFKEAETLSIMREAVIASNMDITVSENGLKAIFDKTEKKYPDRAQPRKSLDALSLMMKRIHSFRVEAYTTNKWQKSRNYLQRLKSNDLKGNPLSDLTMNACEDVLEKITKARADFEKEDANLKEFRREAHVVKKYLTYEKRLRKLSHSLFESAIPIEISERNKRLIYIHFFALKTVSQKILLLKKNLPQDMPLELDETFVNSWLEGI